MNKVVVKAGLILLVVLCMQITAAYAYDFGEYEDLGYAAWLSNPLKAAAGYGNDGQYHIYTISQSASKIFYEINPDTGEAKTEILISEPTGQRVWAIAMGDDHNVYFIGFSDHRIYRFNTLTKQISFVGNVSDASGSYFFHMVPSGDGKMYFGASGGTAANCLYELDIATGRILNLGVMNQNAYYIHGLAVSEKYVFCGTGGTTDTQALIRYNRQTGTKSEFRFTSPGTHITGVSYSNGKVFVLRNGINVIDAETLVLEKKLGSAADGYWITAADPDNSNEIYYFTFGLNKYLIDTNTTEAICQTPSTYTGGIVLDMMKSENGEKRLYWMKNGKSIYCAQLGPNAVVKEIKLKFEIKGETAPNMLSVSKDNILYIGGYGGGFGIYDLDNREITGYISNINSIEGLSVMGGKVYLGIYPGAYLYKFDPEKPINYIGNKVDITANPIIIHDDVHSGNDRPYIAITADDNKVFFGNIAGYGLLSGEVYGYSEEELFDHDGDGDPHFRAYRPFANQSVTGLAYKNGKLYASSTINGGIGSTPETTKAQVARINIETGTVEVCVEPEIPNLSEDLWMIGQMAFGPDGLLWAAGTSDGVVFGMDPDTLAVLKSVKLRPGIPHNASGYYGYQLQFGEDGTLYTTAGLYNISAIDLSDLSIRTLISSQYIMNYMTLDQDQNILYPSASSTLRLLPADQWDRLVFHLNALGKEKLNPDNYEDAGYFDLESAISLASRLDANSAHTDLRDAVRSLKSARASLKDIRNRVTNLCITENQSEQTLVISGRLVNAEHVMVSVLVKNAAGIIVESKEIQADAEGVFQTAIHIAGESFASYQVILDNDGFDSAITKTVRLNRQPGWEKPEISVDYILQSIQISGQLYFTDDRRLTMKITAPGGKIVYMGEVIADLSGVYLAKVAVEPFESGEYDVSVYSPGANSFARSKITLFVPESGMLAQAYTRKDSSGEFCGVRLSNYEKEPLTVKLFVAVYEGEVLKSVSVLNQVAKEKEFTRLECLLPQGDRIRLYVWDEKLRPLLEMYKIEPGSPSF